MKGHQREAPRLSSWWVVVLHLRAPDRLGAEPGGGIPVLAASPGGPGQQVPQTAGLGRGCAGRRGLGGPFCLWRCRPRAQGPVGGVLRPPRKANNLPLSLPIPPRHPRRQCSNLTRHTSMHQGRAAHLTKPQVEAGVLTVTVIASCVHRAPFLVLESFARLRRGGEWPCSRSGRAGRRLAPLAQCLLGV